MVSKKLSMVLNKLISSIVTNYFLAVLWVITLLLYIFRSIFEPLVYPAALSIVLLIFFCGLYLVNNWSNQIVVSFFKVAKENIVLMIFIVVAIISSTNVIIHPIKELVNLIIVLVLLFTFLIVSDSLYLGKFIKYWIVSALSIGVMSLLTWLNQTLSMDLWLFNYIESLKSVEAFISLTSDYNFYALIFLIAIIFQLYEVYKTKTEVNSFFVQIVLWIFTINVLFSGSRRALIFLSLFFLWSLFVSIKHYRARNKNFFIKNVIIITSTLLSIIVIIGLLLPFRNMIIKSPTLRYNISYNTYRFATIFDKIISYDEIHLYLWETPYSYVNYNTNWDSFKSLKSVNYLNQKYENSFDLQYSEPIKDSNNLILNGDFSSGLRFWSSNARNEDSITIKIIESDFGNAVRVERVHGDGTWSLTSRGHPIMYYKGVTYKFKFKFRVIKGKGIPFNIGWWIKDDGKNRYNLQKNITKLDSEWNLCECSYTFNENHKGNYLTFMNFQKENTIIDFADIYLTTNNNSLEYRVKPTIYNGKVNLLYNSDFKHGLKYWGRYSNYITEHKVMETGSMKFIQVKQKEGRAYWPLFYRGRDLYMYKNHEYVFRFMYRIIEGSISNFDVGYAFIDSNKRVYSISKQSYVLSNNWSLCTVSFIPKEDHFVTKPIFISNQRPNTIVQYSNIELLCDSSLIDSSYIDQNLDKYRAYKKFNMQGLTKSDTIDKLIAPRLDRWKYAIEIFKSYSTTEKIFGKGFDYMAQFNQKFYNPDMSLDEIREKQMYDYPHSPILSSFLFSGIIGGLFYLYFTALTFWYYFKNRKELQVFFIMWLIGYSFIIVSDNTHFSAPIFVILSLVPYVWERLPGMKNNITNPTEKKQI